MLGINGSGLLFKMACKHIFMHIYSLFFQINLYIVQLTFQLVKTIIGDVELKYSLLLTYFIGLSKQYHWGGGGLFLVGVNLFVQNLYTAIT